MKKPNIDNWNYVEGMECLLIFANIVDETTFNYTTDSYKASALHTLSLVEESLQTIENIDNGTIREGALQSVIEELKWSVEHDDVFKSLVSMKGLSGLISKINAGVSRSDLKTILLMTHESITTKDYLIEIKKSISKLVKGNREKQKIEVQARLLVSHLKYMGYAEEYIFSKNKDLFLSGHRNVTSVDDIDVFLECFSGIDVPYKAILIVNNVVSQIEGAIEEIGDKVEEDFDLGFVSKRVDSFKKKRSPKWKFLISNISAKDPFSARSKAEDQISSLANLYSFYHHKNTLRFHNVAMIVESLHPGNFIKIKKPTPHIVRCKDLRPISAGRLFLNAANHIDMERDSLLRVMKSLKLHQAALTAETLENQFVNLFTALEILIPKREDSNDNRISQIYDTLIPYLCLDYYDKLLSSVVVTLRQWNPAMLNHIEQTVIEGTTITEKVCIYMLLDKYEQDLDGIVYPAITADNYLLLRQRMFRLHEMMKKPSEILKHLKHHEQKLKWHIDRIYRTRNLIVHAGISPHYLETLLENIHSYYDILITRIIYDNLNRGLSRLEYSYMLYEVEYREYLNRLQKIQSQGDCLTETNILEAVLLQK